ncbi:MAG: hydroxymethylbilane synthase [Candidatus Kapabacteria bacterium]|nr:hydroxymethylbilane synthase [Candidatus Kapabacteria bacterium]
MIIKKYIVATRPSLLAYTQTEQTVNFIREKNPGIEFEIVKFSTQGDKITDKPLTEFGGTGVFVKELENAILEGKAHFAIHSLKDVPGIQPENMTLACFVKREDPRDLLLTNDGRTLDQLPDNCIIGTGSPRRIVQIANLKHSIKFKELRGNIDTRLRKLFDGEYDAILLAAAGMNRLGKMIPESAYLPLDNFIPAIGQGTIALECLSDDFETIAVLKSINHAETEIATIAERSFMKTIGGGCKFPLAAYATVTGSNITLNAMIGNHYNFKTYYTSASAEKEQAVQLGIELAEEIKQAAISLDVKIS